ncbi:MAG: type II toxin-antitoxin system RelE/ParE family toxin [Candidatus Omnitrophota bacterium]|nr:type II toxin-antitoxin system RelE/ParE family toxin [Candidatus Omnitrophota bacterium]
MDKFEVTLVSQALKFYKKCPLELAGRLNKCFEILETNPFHGQNIKLLRGTERRYRYRIGGYRVIYSIDKDSRKVIVTLISPRPSAYHDI